jgi:hypothetical protein
VRSSVGWLDGFVYHLWHGDKADRLYDQRLDLLIEHDFDPQRDLCRGDDHCLHWATEKPELHEWCANYFALRKES